MFELSSFFKSLKCMVQKFIDKIYVDGIFNCPLNRP